MTSKLAHSPAVKTLRAHGVPLAVAAVHIHRAWARGGDDMPRQDNRQGFWRQRMTDKATTRTFLTGKGTAQASLHA